MGDVNPAIAVVPYGVRLDRAFSKRGVDTLEWPLGMPGRLKNASVGDLSSSDHLICYPSSALWLKSHRHIPAKLALMIVEPAAIHRRHMILARIFHRKFAWILTCNPNLLAAIPNGAFLPFGTSWVPEWQSLSLTKSKDISLIASNKNDLAGHKLRHEAARWTQSAHPEVELLGRAYKPFEKKADGLASFRYSIIIENEREPSYFTEKLVDSLLCKTVPIYWGAPNVGQFFEPSGMIICQSLDEIKAAVVQASAKDYAARSEALVENQTRASAYIDLHTRAAQAVTSQL